MEYDDLEFDTLGEKKTALFVIIPDKELSDYDQKNTFDIEDYMKHLQHMKVTPDTEVDDAFDCGEVSGQEDISPDTT